MTRETFPPEVSEKLKHYVYRLIDPRNGETFYVGKGVGNRIFDHARAANLLSNGEDAFDLKLQRIKEILGAGLAVGHVIHRHNIESAEVAFQIEAAVMSAYPGLTNRVGGHGGDEFGVAHVEELVSIYGAEVFEPSERMILISIPKSYEEQERTLYDAVRGTWKIDPKRAKGFGLVLAHRKGLVVGAFEPLEWLPSTTVHFPWLQADIPGRFGFVGREAEELIAKKYIGKRVPDQFRRKGSANPIRFVEP